MGYTDKELERYADMLDLLHYTSPTRARMSRHDRAAQFAPFAALTGHDAAIRETARLTEQRTELDESSKERLDRKLRRLLTLGEDAPEATITYFVDDLCKAGGSYVQVTGVITGFHSLRRTVILDDLTEIPVDRIYGIEASIPEEQDFA